MYVHFDKLETEYGATHIVDALAEYIVKFLNPTMSRQQVIWNGARFPLPFRHLAVYHKAKLWLGDSDHHRLSANEWDSIHVRPAYKNKQRQEIAGRFDTVLVNNGQGSYLGLRGEYFVS